MNVSNKIELYTQEGYDSIFCVFCQNKKKMEKGGKEEILVSEV